jgi:replication-associated recombination protein RarA
MAPGGITALSRRDTVLQQKSSSRTLLEFMENGKLTLIASTTEKPVFFTFTTRC